jgi:diguanylate cyclase (GGDEF)-like protein
MLQWLYRLLKQYGTLKSSLILTIASIALSVLLTNLLNLYTDGRLAVEGTVIAIIVPGIIAPLFSLTQLRLMAQLDRAREAMQRLSITDELTQAFNRRHFIQLAQQEFARAARYGSAFSVIIFDVDDFKHVNDRHGHAAGDAVLRVVADFCQQTIRAVDVFARYGGEEFVLLLPHTDETRAREVADRVREGIASTHIVWQRAFIQVTVSVGVATYSPGYTDFDALLVNADQALYEAKSTGKNRVVAARATPVTLNGSPVVVDVG